MKNPRTGSSLLIIGAVFCLFGLMLALHQTNLMEYITNVFPNIQSAELAGILLQLVGVTLLVAGLSILISEIVERNIEKFTFNVNRAIAELKSATLQTTKSTTKNCRFCGAPLDEGEIFCSACGRAQK